ncbi:oxidoreductase [Heliocybe sulcata]|uniref:3-dehydrosphinganine reductase n=1 Tax=Heliocybe sulcata TaxID=5364 RepID=A0A5C3NGB2_9AGAM|nr:oxidoreductase [Heliocybe sulcata]
MFSWLPTILAVSLASGLVLLLQTFVFSKKRWDPRGQHCYVTGGSAGLGLSLAILLTRKGADVSIVARDEERLQKALELMEAERRTPNQLLKSYSYSLHDATCARDALEAACHPHGGKCPDVVFLCAGSSTPGFFIEEDDASLRRGMDNTYWAAAWSALAAAKRMVRHRAKGKIVFVSSVLGYMSIIGYSSYSPGKFAIRGLAETLRSELQLYPIDVHIFFPGTIYSPGYENENKTKPKVTLKIEEADEGLKPEQAAQVLLDGVQRNYFHVSADFNINIFRTTSRGPTPLNNALFDWIYAVIGWIALPLWRWSVDRTIKNHRKDHLDYLEQKGFFSEDAVGSNHKVIAR